MDLHAAGVAAIDVGRAGTWVGPLLVGAAAGALDYSAIGPHAMRDRLAVIGYYASAVSFVHLLGLAEWERSMVTDYNWRMIGALASLITHGALLLAMFGGRLAWTKALAAAVAGRLKFDSEASKAAKVNTALVGWAVAAAVAAPLSGQAGWGAVVDWIGGATTGMWSGIARFILSWFGG
jgi:hypothetical protein